MAGLGVVAGQQVAAWGALAPGAHAVLADEIHVDIELGLVQANPRQRRGELLFSLAVEVAGQNFGPGRGDGVAHTDWRAVFVAG